ncbi:exocyst complex component EXO70B1-like [Diospyros lotus]|uniref:exocyst complex component EXO70B1-like n=1 Tax=Diospyros lotus TaxID=55363 RepID=UPI002255AEC4|nr:exocyst complex component EXO70B1-like [Diospyros lotus]
MEKIHHSEKAASFIGRHVRRKSDVSTPKTPDLSTNDQHRSDVKENIILEDEIDDQTAGQVFQEIDRFTETLSAVDDKSKPPDVPESVETFLKLIESGIAKYYSANGEAKLGKITEDDSFFLEAVKKIAKLSNAFGDFPSTPSLNRTSAVLQRAMSFFEDLLRDLLEECKTWDRSALETGELNFPPEVVTRMTTIASTMIEAGYETECCQVYSVARRNGFNELLKNLKFDMISMDDAQKMQWETLEAEIAKWIKVAKHCAGILLSGERDLCDSVFCNSPSISEILFSNLARAVVIQLLNFVDAVVLTRRFVEKLFKYLDMYETLRNLVQAINTSCSENCSRDLSKEISAIADRVGEAAASIFCDLENSIKSDTAKTAVPGGAIHPLTSYVMNYLEYTCEYKDAMEEIFRKNAGSENQAEDQPSPFAKQLMTAMDLLDANLSAKSNLYKDQSLSHIFLMNNGRYILQKIKASSEILQLVGDTWYRTRSTVVRQYHKNYQRETWGKVLQNLNQEVAHSKGGKVNKAVVKERMKTFNTQFEEIHKTQSTWVVSDEQLQSELRVAISALVIPAYRNLLGRFRQNLEKADKYIKYQPEDVEALIDELFDGNPTSMGKKKT